MGAFDLPAALTHVRSKTSSKKKLFYVGHSMGTVMFWVAMNERQSLMEDSVELMVAMGPVARVKHIESPVRILAPVSKEVDVRPLEICGLLFYSVSHLVADLGLGCYTTLPWQKVATVAAHQPGELPKLSQPNPRPRPDETPCI